MATRAARSNEQPAEVFEPGSESTGRVSAGDIGLRRHRATTGGITPPRRKPGLPADKVRNTGSGNTARPALRPQGRPRESADWIGRYRLQIMLGTVVLVVLIAGTVGTLWAWRSFAASQLFALQKIDIQGAVQVPHDELAQMLRQKIGNRSLWQADLSGLRGEVVKQPWVRDAQVERVLPDTLRVIVTEREPFAPVRRSNGSLYWVDRDGIDLGERVILKDSTIPPVINGLEEASTAAAASANKERLDVYQQVMADLDREQPKLSDKLDEIELGDAREVTVRLVEKKVKVILGETGFRPRLLSALKVLESVEKKDVASLGLLNASDAERIARGDRVAYLRATRDDRVTIKLAQKED